jgi:hypothetical protein
VRTSKNNGHQLGKLGSDVNGLPLTKIRLTAVKKPLNRWSKGIQNQLEARKLSLRYYAGRDA